MKMRLLLFAVATVLGAGLVAPVPAQASASLPLSIGNVQLAANGVAGLVSTTVRCPAAAILQTDQKLLQPQIANARTYEGFATYTCTGRPQQLTLVADSCGGDPCPRLQPGRATEVQISVSYSQPSGPVISATSLQVRRPTAISSYNAPAANMTLAPTGAIELNGLTARMSATIRCPKGYQVVLGGLLRQARAHGLSQTAIGGLAPGASDACTGRPHRYPMEFSLSQGAPWHPGPTFLDAMESAVGSGQQGTSEAVAYRTVVLDPGGAP